MSGDTTEPRITSGDVHHVARHGERVWRVGERGSWRLTLDDLLAIDDSWGGDPDELSPMVAQAIADALNRQRPWRQPEDLDQPLGWADGIDTSRPSASRVYDYLLGGSHNFGADREFARKLVEREPLAPAYARANRAFLHRAVRFLLEAGVRQFIDLGSGVPTVGNVHEVAQRVVPRARVVYVDIDPIAVAHSQHILADNPHVTAVQVDLRRPEVILAHPETQQLIDFSAPVGLLMVAVLHFVPDGDDPAEILAQYRRALAPGSYLGISHACLPEVETPQAVAARDAYHATATPLFLRRPEQVGALLAGWTLVSPGLVEVTRWRPDEDEPPSPVPGVAGVARLVDTNTPGSRDDG